MEKQIEEMAGIIKPIIVTSYVLCDANSKHRASEQIKKDKLKNATALYNAGYRKGKPISEYVKEVHENAVAHGWYDGGEKNFGELLMLITTEAAEVMEEYRKGKGFKETYTDEKGKMCGIPSELADIVIRVMDLCGYYGIDLEQAIKEKHEYNKSRPYKHGGKKC